MKYFYLFNIGISYFFVPLFLKLKKNIVQSERLKIKEFPMIDIRNKSRLILGNNVTINSSNYGYHINMFSSVKILADGEEAIISIGNNTRIHGACIHAKKKILIGENCLIAANCHIIDSNGHDTAMDNPTSRMYAMDVPKDVVIEDNVWIGANCLILKGVTIGEGSIVAAGSVVSKDVPPFSIAGGNPAQVLKGKS